MTRRTTDEADSVHVRKASEHAAEITRLRDETSKIIAKRDLEVVRAVDAGVKPSVLARRLSMSKSNVWNIVRAHRGRR